MVCKEKLDQLNPQQREAVLTTEGYVLVLAGAGSGKTSVLAHRIAYLIDSGKAQPEEILGLTFTNKAAGEMRERVASITSKSVAKKVVLSTFHSFCMRILRKEIAKLGYTQQFSLYSERDMRRLVTTLTKQILGCEKDLPSLEPTLAAISRVKNKGGFEEGEHWHDDFTKELYEKLSTSMRAYNAVDFDSLLTLTQELFVQHPEVLSKYQEQFRYVMVDEYQDTNRIQNNLVQMIAKKWGNLCVVGDDDQSIYGWRGAEVRNILEFPAAKTIALEQNYRSTPRILKGANAVIRNNEERHSKELWSHKVEGHPIVVFTAPAEAEEAKAVADRLVYLHEHFGIPWREMAVLYRSNILARNVELTLMQTPWKKDGEWRRGIPYRVFGGTELFERSEIKDLLAYLKVIANPLDQQSLLRIINVPRRGISEQTLDRLTRYNRENNIPLWHVLEQIAQDPSQIALEKPLSSRGEQGIKNFVSLIEEMKQLFEKGNLEKSLRELIERVNYKRAIEEEVKSEKMRAFKWENLTHAVTSIGQYEQECSEEGKEADLCDFLHTTLLDEKKWKAEDREKSNQVHLMTFHSAKGLEFSACFLIGLEDHLIPHEKSLKETGLEEERRLLYVAMTRAKKYLTLSMAKMRQQMGKSRKSTPSRFIHEIPRELLKISTWQTTSDYE